MALEILEQADFTGGINTQAIPSALAPNQMPRARNLILTRAGGLSTRPGMTTLDTIGAQTDQVIARFSWSRNDGVLVHIAIVHNGSLSRYEVWGKPSGVWTFLGALSATGVLNAQTVVFNNQVLVGDNVNPIKTTNGTSTFAALAGTALGVPSAPTITPIGTAGTTTYTYKIAAENLIGSGVASAGGTTTTGNATLDSAHGNRVTWPVIEGATQYGVYRTVGGVTQGRIAPVGATSFLQTDHNTVVYTDFGTVGNGLTAPTVDTSTRVPPGAVFLTSHLGAMWAFNTAASSSGIDGPASLQQSLVGDSTTWPQAYQAWVAKDDGQPGTGMSTFSVAEAGIAPDPFLVVFKTYATYVVSGMFTPDGGVPVISRAKTDMGCLAPNSIQFISVGDVHGILRLTHRGFALFDGVNDTLLSNPIQPYLFGGQGELAGMNSARIHYAVSCQTQDPSMYLCAFATGPNTGFDVVMAFDIRNRAWLPLNFPHLLMGLGNIQTGWGANALVQTVMGEYGGNHVYLFDVAASTDDGAPIAWDFMIRPVGRHGELLYYHQMLLTAFNLQPNALVTAAMALGARGDRQNLTRTSGSKTLVGGVDEDLPYTWVEAELPFAIGLVGDTLWATISGTDFINIRGVQYHVRAKARRRPVKMP